MGHDYSEGGFAKRLYSAPHTEEGIGKDLDAAQGGNRHHGMTTGWPGSSVARAHSYAFSYVISHRVK